MMKLNTLVAAALAVTLSACGSGESADTPTPALDTDVEAITSAQVVTPILAEVSSAKYVLEPTHVSLNWSLSHNGLSNYMARFTHFEADLNFNAEDPTLSTLTATIDPTSVRTSHPTDTNWDTEIATDEKFLNAGSFPNITFVSTGVTLTGEDTGLIVGDLTLLGVTSQVTLETQFNGVKNFPWTGERDVIGFSATTALKRSDYEMTALLPDIGDEITVTIEAEFVQVE